MGNLNLAETIPGQRVLRRISLILAVCFCHFLVPFAKGQSSPSSEYVSKATFLANFPNFAEWPPDAFPNSSSPFALCVVGDFSFGTTLAELTRSTRVQGHRIDVRWIRKIEELSSCHMVFVSRSQVRRYARMIELLRPSSVLTVGETPEFLGAGGIMSFSVAQDALQFDVNLEAANHARLKISSRLLVLARQVIYKREEGRS
jgi:hypothetical protein